MKRIFRSGVVASTWLFAALLSTMSAAALAQQPDGPPVQVIVKWRAPAGATTQLNTAPSRALADASARLGVGTRTLRRLSTGADVIQLNRRVTQAELKDFLDTLAQDPNVQYAEPDLLLQHALIPNDTRYNEQWHYFEAIGGLNLVPAWDITTGTGVTVAVIDTGFRPHVDLAPNIVGGFDFISDTFIANDGNGRDTNAQDPGDWNTAGQCPPNPNARNSSWHGTHVAGTIAATTNNGNGVAGVAFGARVVPVRVLGRCGGLTSDIADAITWASGGAVAGVAANPNVARVINLSLGGPGTCGATMQTAINGAVSRGTVVIVAAGNENQNAANATPANCAGVITIAATDRNGGRAFYSNFGANVDVAAPGGDISFNAGNGVLSTLNTGTTTPGADAYTFYQGTSMATPHVAGVAALMLSRNPALTPAEIETHLRASSRAFPAACNQCGAGIVDALAAVEGSAACPAGYTTRTGTLLAGQSVYYSAPTPKTGTPPLQTSLPTTFSGRLTGPGQANFNLYLEWFPRGTWNTFASSEGPTSTESIDTNASSFRASFSFRWRVFAASGSGAFRACTRVVATP
jgi:serine protease